MSFPKSKNQILYGGVNIVNSDVELINIEIVNSNSEDAINIISSNSNIRNLKVKNIQADAIDIDFGTLNFKNIFCENTIIISDAYFNILWNKYKISTLNIGE